MVKTQLLIISLQHQCQFCGRYLREEDHFSIDVPPQIRSTHNNSIPSNLYFCKSCASIHFSQAGPYHIHPRKTVNLVDMNPLLTSPIFSDRHVFLGFCQENHFEFSEVSDPIEYDLVTTSSIFQLWNSSELSSWSNAIQTMEVFNGSDIYGNS